ncbi:Polynucleotide 5'-hydroxyl-kinase grc3 [Coemansia sp. RSA 988]|nr:Polynucleotide 5'-hydroxyl-kinase grc3 [Coemansia sp. RSA 988]
MNTTPSRRSPRVFTPRATRSALAGQTASPIRSSQSPMPASITSAAETSTAFATMDLKDLPNVTTWRPELACVTMAVGAKYVKGKKKLSSISLNEPLASRFGVVFDISQDQTIAFQGIVDVCVLTGTISTYEYMISTSDPWMRIYSPSSHPLATLHISKGRKSNELKHKQRPQTKDNDKLQMQALWNEHISERDNTGDAVRAVVALRYVDCGIDKIGIAAPPYRNLFSLKPFIERKGAGMPKKFGKRRIALARIKAAFRAIKPASGDLDRDAETDNAESDDEALGEDMAVDEESGAGDVAMVVERAQLEFALAHSIGLPGFTAVGHLTAELQLLQAPQDWVSVLDQASNAPLRLDEAFEPIPPVYVVAGGQGLGKSTFSRFLVNRLINRYGCVFYMETDLGQSELAPPGALALTMLTDPLFGPPFTHIGQVEPYHAVYLGTTTPKNDPDRYVLAIRRLSSIYREYVSSARIPRKQEFGMASETNVNDMRAIDEQVVPLLVNTQGWLKGLGLDLHYSLCQEVRPTNYIQFYDPSTVSSAAATAAAGSAQNQLDYEMPGYGGSSGREPIIDFDSIADCDPQLAWISAMGFERATQLLYSQAQSKSAMDTSDIASNHALVAGTAEGSNRKGPKLSAHDMRTLALLMLFYSNDSETYTTVNAQSWNSGLRKLMNPSWNMQVPLASRCPLAVPWSDLVFWLGEEDIPPSQMLRTLNGVVVGVICVATAASPDAHTWTDDELHGLYSDKGISDQGAIELSQPGSRALLSSSVRECQSAHKVIYSNETRPLPQIVYGYPNVNTTTFLTHAIVRSVDPAEGHIHLLLPPLVTSLGKSRNGSNGEASLSKPLHRVVGIFKGPGSGASGIELPVWAMVNGGYAERAMGFAKHKLRRFEKPSLPSKKHKLLDTDTSDGEVTNLGIQEAPYLSVEVDAGIGASSSKSWGGQMRRALQG